MISTEIPIASVWSSRIALSKAAQVFVNKCMSTPQLSVPENQISQLWESLKIVAGDQGYESVRTAGVKAVADFVEWVNGHPEWVTIQEKIKRDLVGMIAAETSSVIQAEYPKVKE